MLNLTHYRNKKPHQNMAKVLIILFTPSIGSLQITTPSKKSSTSVTLKHIFKSICLPLRTVKSSKKLCLITVKVAMSVFWSFVVAPNKAIMHRQQAGWTTFPLLVLCFFATLAQNNQLQVCRIWRR